MDFPTFYVDDLGWFLGHEGWPFIAGSLAYCLQIVEELRALRERV